MKRRILAAAAAIICLSACSAPAPKIETVEEKIGNLTIQAPVGWEKNTSDDSDYWKTYSYTKNDKDDSAIAILMVFVDNDTEESVSISDFDYMFEDSSDGLDIKYTDVSDSFLGDKPIRIGKGTYQYNYNGNIGPLYDLLKIAMYDADLRGINVQYMYLDEMADQGYADYADTLLDTMQLIYDYQYTTGE